MCKCSNMHPEQGFIFQNIINYFKKSLFTINHIGNPWKQTVKHEKQEEHIIKVWTQKK